MTSPVRILLLDDHGLFREGLARLLNAEPDLSVVAHCASIDKALSILSGTTVDLILVDYELSDEVGTNILNCLAVLQSSPRVLLVTAGMTKRTMQDALNAGALGIVLKHTEPQQLVAAIRVAVNSGTTSRATPDPEMVLTKFNGEGASYLQDRILTRRQSKALHAILDGCSNREIGTLMNISESAAKAIVQELFEKAGVRTRSQLVRVALERYAKDWINQGT